MAVAITDTEINPVVTKAAGGGGYRVLGPEVEGNPTYFGEGGGGWNVFVETEINPTYVVDIREAGKMVGLPPGLIELLTS